MVQDPGTCIDTVRPTMRLLISLACFAALVATSVAEDASGATIRLRADTYCPTNCAPDAERPGYAVEIAREVFAKAGLEIEYDLLAWQRAIEDGRAGLIDGVIGAGPGEVPGFTLGREPIGMWQLGLAVRRGEAACVDPANLSTGRVLGAVEGYGYGADWLETYVAEFGRDPARVQLLSGPAALATNLRKLVNGRVDCVPDSVAVLQYQINQLGFSDDLDIAAIDPERSEVFIAFSPSNPRSGEWAAILDQGVAEMRSSGRLAEVLATYGLQDWR